MYRSSVAAGRAGAGVVVGLAVVTVCAVVVEGTEAIVASVVTAAATSAVYMPSLVQVFTFDKFL